METCRQGGGSGSNSSSGISSSNGVVTVRVAVLNLYPTPSNIVILFSTYSTQLLPRICNAYNLSKLLREFRVIICRSKHINPLD
jgi:hypothetical protein